MRIVLAVANETCEAALACEADAWVVNLGQSDASALAGRLAETAPARRPPLSFRVGRLAEVELADALAASALPRPSTLFIPAEHGRDIAQAGSVLAVHEAEQGWPDGATRIVALVTSAAGALNLASFADASPRLTGIGWDAGALADELGMGRTAMADELSAPLAQVRSLVRLAAAAVRVEAIETACPQGINLQRYAEAAQRDGFGAIVADPPEDVRAIRAWLNPAR